MLKDGTENSQGKAQIFSNIAACEAIGAIVQTTMGPRGMDKLIHDGGDVTVTNDGATVLRKLNIIHPAGMRVKLFCFPNLSPRFVRYFEGTR